MADLCDYIGYLLRHVLGAILGATMVVLPLCNIYFGALYFLDPSSCPLEPMISIFLMVLGCITLAYVGVCMIQTQIFEEESPGSAERFIWIVIVWFLVLGFIGWTITGIVWYGLTVSKGSTDSSSDYYCNDFLYKFFSSQVILSCILMLFVLFWICCVCYLSRSLTSDPEGQSIIQRPNEYPVNSANERATVQPTVERLIQAFRRGPNMFWMYKTVRDQVVRIVT